VVQQLSRNRVAPDALEPRRRFPPAGLFLFSVFGGTRRLRSAAQRPSFPLIRFDEAQMRSARPTRRQALTLAASALLPAGAGRARATLSDALDRARRLDQLHAIIVSQRGETLAAEAFRGPPVDRPVNVKSVSKTIVAALTGIAIERNVLSGPDQRLTEFVSPPAGADPRVAEISVDHLLTMRAGLERTSGRNYGGWVSSGDWVADALRRPFIAEPGGRFLYSTGSYHLLGAALTEASGRSLLALARDWLGDPLGVEIPPWTRDPQGFYMGGNNMALSPLALARFGETALNGGRFGGAQVLPQSWIADSWTPRTRSPWSGDFYGYGWFLTRLGGYTTAYARGYGGQLLYVVPEIGLTVAITSDATRPARSDGHVGALRALMTEAVIPALA
jgi:CubicO group peptidase (beta-lactamase class C family)